MPGIAGIIRRAGSAATRGAIETMIASMKHEAFYSSGSVSLEGCLNVELGWANHSGSFSDCMPVWNERKDVCLVSSGEEFTEPAALEALRSQGHCFDGSNAQYLVHLYEEFGEQFVGRLNGWISGVIVDQREGKVLVFNDRYGLNRIYFHESPDAFYFSSEAKSLLAVAPATRQVDLRAAGEFFSCGCTLGNKTLFQGISILPPASTWVFSRDYQICRNSSFDRSQWESLSPVDPEEYFEEMCATFPRVVSRYLRGNAPIGMSLTGGVDSRMILAWSETAKHHLQAYTFGGMYRDSRDVRLAREVAKRCGLGHSIITVDGEFQKQFPGLAEKTVFISDGTMDVTGAVELYVNRLARNISTTRLSGSYGGEIMRGIVAFKPARISDEVLAPELRAAVQEASATYQIERRERALSFIAFKQVPWHHHARFSIERSQLNIRSPFLDNDLVALSYRTPDSACASSAMALRIAAKGAPALGSLETDRFAQGQSSRWLSQARHLWQEFTFKAEYAYDYGMPNWVARIDRVLKPLRLEKAVLGRHKFYHFRPWYRDSLASYVQEILLDSRTLSRPFFDRRHVEHAVTSHVHGTGNYTVQIHRLLTFELAIRTLCERDYRAAAAGN